MYYVEKTINGKLCYRGKSTGDWIEFTSEQLNERIADLEKRLLEVFNELQETKK